MGEAFDKNKNGFTRKKKQTRGVEQKGLRTKGQRDNFFEVTPKGPREEKGTGSTTGKGRNKNSKNHLVGGLKVRSQKGNKGLGFCFFGLTPPNTKGHGTKPEKTTVASQRRGFQKRRWGSGKPGGKKHPPDTKAPTAPQTKMGSPEGDYGPLFTGRNSKCPGKKNEEKAFF